LHFVRPEPEQSTVRDKSWSEISLLRDKPGWLAMVQNNTAPLATRSRFARPEVR
jgi:hypothetical protein